MQMGPANWPSLLQVAHSYFLYTAQSKPSAEILGETSVSRPRRAQQIRQTSRMARERARGHVPSSTPG